MDWLAHPHHEKGLPNQQHEQKRMSRTQLVQRAPGQVEDFIEIAQVGVSYAYRVRTYLMAFTKHSQTNQHRRMAKRQLLLTAQEISQLAVAEQQTEDKHARVRYLAIRLYGQSWPMKKIQEVTQAAESTIHQWAMAYRADGLEGLRSKWTGKSANKLSDEQHQQIRERLHQYRPVDLHLSERVHWTVSDLRSWF
jgi:transposase